MTASDNTGEASMDEILASIRKIIADDPNQPRTAMPDRRAVNPLTDPASALAHERTGFDRDARPLPPADRLAEAIRTNAAAPRPVQPAPVPAQPTARSRPMLNHGLDDLIDDGPRGGLNLNTNAVASPAPAPIAETAPQDAASGTWASWRSFKAAPAPSVPEPAQAPIQVPAPQSEPIAAIPARETEPSLGFRTLTEESAADAVVKNAPSFEPEPAPQAAPPAPAAKAPSGTKSFTAAFPRPSVEATIAPAAAVHTNLNGHGLTNGTPLISEIPTAEAANAALEKLAVGLAELPPVAAMEASAAEAVQQPVQSSPPPPPASSPPPATGRTLEDTVTDMLRPMLEKWIETNMPRLMEKALRGDLNKGSKP